MLDCHHPTPPHPTPPHPSTHLPSPPLPCSAGGSGWDSPLAAFPEISPKTLEYDMEDARRFKVRCE